MGASCSVGASRKRSAEIRFILDRAETGNPALDSILKEIAEGAVQQNAQYWIERLAPHAESIIDLTLDCLVDLKAREHHDKVSPENYKLRFNSLPSKKPSMELKFHIAEQRRALPLPPGR